MAVEMVQPAERPLTHRALVVLLALLERHLFRVGKRVYQAVVQCRSFDLAIGCPAESYRWTKHRQSGQFLSPLT